MRSISQGLGLEHEYTLAEVTPVSDTPSKTMKSTPEVTKVDPKELEYAYIKHPVTYNSINLKTQAIMSAGYKLQCDDVTVLAYFNNFLNNIGQVGEELTFNEILEAIFKYQMIYGNAYIETVLNKYENNIVDLALIDPKTMDYAKDGSNKIVLDKYNMPVGYVQKLPYEMNASERGDPIPEEYKNNIRMMSNEIFLLRKRVCHFKLNTYGDRFYGIGLIEPGYVSTYQEMAIKKAQVNTIEQRGESPLVDYVGDEFHEPTPNQIQNALTNLKSFKYNRYFAFPYWHKITPIDAPPNGVTLETLKYLREDISASLGMPMAFATGSGEATNRSTLDTQQLFLTFTLEHQVANTTATIKKYIFKRICDYNGFTCVPNLAWGHIGVEEFNQKAKRIVEYIKSGALVQADVRPFIIKSERL